LFYIIQFATYWVLGTHITLGKMPQNREGDVDSEDNDGKMPL